MHRYSIQNSPPSHSPSSLKLEGLALRKDTPSLYFIRCARTPKLPEERRCGPGENRTPVYRVQSGRFTTELRAH